ncbi:MAG TPA: methyltransferase domain-containing protein [Polyangiaceae bacterium]|jgi:SAM-dependent methyltransferase
MREELELNRSHWDEATRLHARGNVYGVEDFRAGACRLHRVEVEEVGDVRDKRLLHLQCHFGLDTLSWARRGAVVTGVDFSAEGIAFARQLSADTGVPARFIESDLYVLPEALDEPHAFDIVYTSYGVLNWLPDLEPWGAIVGRYLKPGGFFYIVEGHPSARIFPTDEDMPQAGSFHPWFSYFHDPAGMRWPPGADYADPSAMHCVGAHEWQHSLGDIVNALTRAGLVVEWLHEFPFCAWQVVAGCDVVERFSSSHAYYGLPASQPKLPLMFSLRASAPLA